MTYVPTCRICGKEKVRGTLTKGKFKEPFWMCGTLQTEHDEILAHDDDIIWDDEDPDDLDWEDV